MANPYVVGATIQAGTQMGGGLFRGIGARRNRRMQAKMFQLNWNRAEEWRKQDQLREDTAVQRRVADLKQAGLSPTLAAGSAAQTASHQSQTQAPQTEQGLDKFGEAMQNLGMQNQVMQIMKMKKDISLSDSQIALNREKKLSEIEKRVGLSKDNRGKAWNNFMFMKILGLPTTVNLDKYGQTYAKAIENMTGASFYEMFEADHASQLKAGVHPKNVEGTQTYQMQDGSIKTVIKSKKLKTPEEQKKALKEKGYKNKDIQKDKDGNYYGVKNTGKNEYQFELPDAQ